MFDFIVDCIAIDVQRIVQLSQERLERGETRKKKAPARCNC